MFYYVVKNENGIISFEYKTQIIEDAVYYVEIQCINRLLKMSYKEEIDSKTNLKHIKYNKDIVYTWCEFSDWFHQNSYQIPKIRTFMEYLNSCGIEPSKWSSISFKYFTDYCGNINGCSFFYFDNINIRKVSYCIVRDIEEDRFLDE